ADGSAAAGQMLQKLPGDAGDDDGWNRAGALFETLSAAELLDWPAEDLLRRLFHEDGVETLGERPVRFGRSCSRERVEAMLQWLGREEADAAVAAAGGTAQVRCEFCGQRYAFSPAEIETLFTDLPTATGEGPARLQ